MLTLHINRRYSLWNSVLPFLPRYKARQYLHAPRIGCIAIFARYSLAATILLLNVNFFRYLFRDYDIGELCDSRARLGCVCASTMMMGYREDVNQTLGNSSSRNSNFSNFTPRLSFAFFLLYRAFVLKILLHTGGAPLPKAFFTLVKTHLWSPNL